MTIYCTGASPGHTDKDGFPEVYVLPATGAPDLLRALSAANLACRGIFAIRDSVDDAGQPSIEIGVRCSKADSEAATPECAERTRRAPDWIARAHGHSEDASTPIGFHIWPRLPGAAADPLRADCVAFVAVSRGGPAGREIALVEEPRRKWSRRGGRWFLPAGHVDAGETFRGAAAREALEEAGVRVAVRGALCYLHRESRGRCHGPHILFAADVVEGFPVDGDGRPALKSEPDHESLSARWFSLSEVMSKVDAEDEESDSFFRNFNEMRVILRIVASGHPPVPIYP